MRGSHDVPDLWSVLPFCPHKDCCPILQPAKGGAWGGWCLTPGRPGPRPGPLPALAHSWAERGGVTISSHIWPLSSLGPDSGPAVSASFFPHLLLSGGHSSAPRAHQRVGSAAGAAGHRPGLGTHAQTQHLTCAATDLRAVRQGTAPHPAPPGHSQGSLSTWPGAPAGPAAHMTPGALARRWWG